MQHSLPTTAPGLTAPSFGLIGRQPLRRGSILLAVLVMTGVLGSIGYAISHGERASFTSGSAGAADPKAAPPDADDKDDPSQIDTIVFGDPADAPVPARRGDHVSPVHPTILVRLPRFGDQVGLIPDTPSGRLLYGWLAAFNQTSYPALGNALPNIALKSATEAQVQLRKQTGGFRLLSAKEVLPGVLVFRLRDQSSPAIEFLGTLQVRPESKPASIATFSLRAVPPPGSKDASGNAAPREEAKLQ